MSNIARTRLIVVFIICIPAILFGAGCRKRSAPPDSRSNGMKTITDSCGRKVKAPETTDRVLTTGPVDMILTYMIAPDKLLGLTMKPNGEFMPDRYRKLPVLGGWYMSRSGNYESFLALNPDVVFAVGPENIERMQSRFGDIPVVCLNRWDGFEGYKDVILQLGNIIGARKQAEELIAWYDEAKNYVDSRIKDIPAEHAVRVYYAEGKEGLSTEPSGSPRTELIKICGGVNVADLDTDKPRGMSEVSMEQVLMWNPDVIIIGRSTQKSLRREIMSNPRWSDIIAVRKSRVYIRPDNPFSWFDGPPGPNQIIGIYWTAKLLYPERFSDLDLKVKTREFYSKFYLYDLNEQQMNSLIGDM